MVFGQAVHYYYIMPVVRAGEKNLKLISSQQKVSVLINLHTGCLTSVNPKLFTTKCLNCMDYSMICNIIFY
jgi:hypothetical protein